MRCGFTPLLFPRGRPGRAGMHATDANAGVLRLGAQHLRQARDAKLRRAICRGLRVGAEPGDRAHEKDVAALPLRHRRQEGRGHQESAAQVRRDHVIERRRARLRERRHDERPGVLMSTSTGPKCLPTARAIAATAFSLVTSHGKSSTSAPSFRHSRAVARRFGSFARHQRQPDARQSAANTCAMAAPMPCEAPVDENEGAGLDHGVSRAANRSP